MNEKIIEVNNLSKSYGDHLVLNDISFSLPKGEIIGLFGPNGCGKSTLMKILTGLIHDYKGSVLINGNAPGDKTKAVTAYLPEQTFIHDWMRNIDAIDYFNDFFKDFDKNKALEMIKRFSLPEKQKCKTMSKGMQEKLLLSLTMARAAELYILDEPMGGVDPATRDYILDTILTNFNEDASVIISTHLISDVERILDEVIFIDGGKIILTADTDELRNNEGGSVDEIFRRMFKC